MHPSEINEVQTEQKHRFAVICVLGPPGVGKGTLCTYLKHNEHLAHFSIGDDLRRRMREDPASPLAREIRSRLSHHGFFPAEVLNPFIAEAIRDALAQNMKGILIDGYPRCWEQLKSLDKLPFRDISPLSGEPDLVLCVGATKANAEARFLSRGRDSNDQKYTFEKRYTEWLRETCEVEEIYRRRGIRIDIDANGSTDVTVIKMKQLLDENDLWKRITADN